MDYDKIRKRIVSKALSKCLVNKQNQLIIPNKALSNEELSVYASCLKVPFFRGVFMKDALPKRILENETAVVNLDDSDGAGTHWVSYKKLGGTVYYFDSFGNLPPPKELKYYFRTADRVLYNHERFQRRNTVICGHLCLEFLASSVSML